MHTFCVYHTLFDLLFIVTNIFIISEQWYYLLAWRKGVQNISASSATFAINIEDAGVVKTFFGAFNWGFQTRSVLICENWLSLCSFKFVLGLNRINLLLVYCSLCVIVLHPNRSIKVSISCHLITLILISYQTNAKSKWKRIRTWFLHFYVIFIIYLLYLSIVLVYLKFILNSWAWNFFQWTFSSKHENVSLKMINLYLKIIN